MYFSVNNYISIGFIELMIERIEKFRQKYLKLAFVEDVVKCLNNELRENSDCLELPEVWFESGLFAQLSKKEYPNLPSQKKENLLRLEENKKYLDAIDFYFMKALLLDDRKEMTDMLLMARMLQPEDVLTHMMCRILEDYPYINHIIFDIAKNWPWHIEKGQVKEYFSMLNAVSDFIHSPENYNINRLQTLIDRDHRYTGLIYTLFVDAAEKNPAKNLLRLLNGLKHNNSFASEFFNLIRCNIWLQNGDSLKALSVIEQMDLEEMNFNINESLFAFNLKAKIYYECGQIGKAMLIYQNITTDKDYNSTFSQYYFQSVISLVSIYAECGQPLKAKETFKLIGHAETLKIVIECLGADYYMMRGHIYLAEKRKRTAIFMYRKSLEIKENNALRAKVKKIESEFY